MGSKSTHEYICLNKKDKKLLKENHLEDILNTEGKKNAPLRTENVRKSIEHHLERRRLKKDIADFDWQEVNGYEEH